MSQYTVTVTDETINVVTIAQQGPPGTPVAINDLSDVNLTGLSVNEYLQWDGANWVNVASAATAAWGGITGTLSNQTDLQAALDLKLADITGESIGDLSDVDLTGSPAPANGDVLQFNGLSWVHVDSSTVGVTDHGALTGLADDDHTQYHNDTRGDARYYTQTQLDAGQLNTLYYTETEVDTLLSGKSDTGHGHASSEITVPVIGTPTYTDVEDRFNIMSVGLVSGGTITDNGDGTVNVAAGSVLIRSTDSDIAQILFADFPLTSSIALTQDELNYIYCEYNAGSPQIIATTSVRADHNTNVLIGTVHKYSPTFLQVIEPDRNLIPGAVQHVIDRFKAIDDFAWESGATITESGNRGIALSSGTFWTGINQFVLWPAGYDTLGSPADTFDYYYRDGLGDWTRVASQTLIDNTQYDDGSGTLALLTGSRYGVHWVYVEKDEHVRVIYGQGNYTLAQAIEAGSPTSQALPKPIQTHGRLLGKIIVQNGATNLYSIQMVVSDPEAFISTPAQNIWTTFNADTGTTICDTTDDALTVTGGTGINTSITGDTLTIAVVDSEITHNNLGSLQGGTPGEYNHLTNAQVTLVNNAVQPGDAAHDGFSDFVANEHIDHSSVILITTAGTSGLSGGGDLTASRDLKVDINGLTADATPNGATDYVMTYDADGGVLPLKKVLLNNLPGGGGGISNVVEDTTPQLGGDLDVNGNSIVSVTNGDIPITPNGTGKTKVTNLEAACPLNSQVGTSYTGVLADADKMITMNNAAANTFTIPANASVAYPVGTKLNIMQLGAGATTIAITTDTLSYDSSLTAVLNGQYAVCTALKIATTQWVLFGNLTPA